MAKIDDDLNRLRAKIEDLEGTVDKAAALIGELLQQLKAAKQQPDIGAAVDDIIDGLQKHQGPLASAVAAGDFQPSGQ